MQVPPVDSSIQSAQATPSTFWALVAAVVVLAVLSATPLIARLVRLVYPWREEAIARWSGRHVAGVALWIVAGMWISMRIGSAPGEDLRVDLVRSTFVFGTAVALVAICAARLQPDGLRALGLPRGRHLRAALAGLAAYVLVLPALLGLPLVWAWLLDRTGVGYAEQPLIKLFAALPPDERLLPIVLGVLAMPLFEEVLFRVFLQRLLVVRLGAAVGIALTALVFAALHGTGAFLPIFALSILLGAVMVRTQRLSAVWTIHALHNGIQFVVLYALPELRKIGG